MAARKLQTEIDRTFKKIDEGIEIFCEIWDKLHDAPSANLKEKHETDLKKEIKKLQRYRDQVKTWASSSEIKHKDPLVEYRRRIEEQMERFKVCEKETKTKAYSKEGLAASAKKDPKAMAKMEVYEWVEEFQDKLKEQIAAFEEELENLEESSGTAKKGKKVGKNDKVDKLQHSLERHQWHIEQLENVISSLRSDKVTVNQVNGIKDEIESYIDQNQEPDFFEDEFLYDALDLSNDDEDDEEGSDFSGGSGGSDDEDDADASDDEDDDGGKGGKTAKAPDSKVVITLKPKEPAPAKPAPAAAAATSAVSKPAAVANPATAVSTSAAAKPTAAVTATSAPAATAAAAKPVATTTATTAAALKKPVVGAVTPASTTAAAPSATAVPATAAARVAPTPTTSSGATVTSAAALVAGRTSAATAAASATTPATSAAALVAGKTAPSAAPTAATSASSTSGTLATPRGTVGAPAAGAAPSASVAVKPAEPAASMLSVVKKNVAASTPAPTAAAATSRTAAASSSSADGAASKTEPDYVSVADVTSSLAGLDLNALQQQMRGPPLSDDQQSQLKQLEASLQFLPDAHDSERPKQYVPRNPYRTPSCFPNSPALVFDDPSICEKFDLDTLFFMFYFHQGSNQPQPLYLAAKELKKQAWRYHKKHRTWFQRHEEPKLTTDEFEQGTYLYFDYEQGWCQRIKSEFVFDYKFLEDDDVLFSR